MPETLTGPEFDLLVVRTVRDRILAGDWGRGSSRSKPCLVDHLRLHRVEPEALLPDVARGLLGVAYWNDTHTQAEVIALLDDVEDSLLGEMGVAG